MKIIFEFIFLSVFCDPISDQTRTANADNGRFGFEYCALDGYVRHIFHH